MMDDIMSGDAGQALTRRGFARLAMAGALAAGMGSLVVGKVAAREAEPGDDRGGHGRDDRHGDDHGRHRHGRDDRRRHRRGHR